jgi:hypothetical protein
MTNEERLQKRLDRVTKSLKKTKEKLAILEENYSIACDLLEAVVSPLRENEDLNNDDSQAHHI